MSPALLSVLLAAAVFVGFLGLAIGGNVARPMVIVGAVLAGVVLVIDLVSAVHA